MFNILNNHIKLGLKSTITAMSRRNGKIGLANGKINFNQDENVEKKSKKNSDNSSSRKKKIKTQAINDNETIMSESTSKKRKLNEIDISDSSKKPVLKVNKKKQMDVPVAKPKKYTKLGVGPSPLPKTGKKYMGCHVSAAGGVWNAFENGINTNSKSIALFLRNQRQWNAKPLEQDTINKWNIALKEVGMMPHLILPHGSYLMNLGSPKEEPLEKSRKLFIDELNRCDRLGIPSFNFHPGSTLGEISREECCLRIAESINLGHKATKSVICVIENMSKQGFTIGGDFHEIRLIIQHVKDKTRVGVCLDTCHSHAAGYDLSTEIGFDIFLSDFETIIGWKYLRGLHMNDSKGQSGDHKDRHEKIGKGTIGLEGFRRIMNCKYFDDMPLILETPYESDESYSKEIALLESLIKM